MEIRVSSVRCVLITTSLLSSHGFYVVAFIFDLCFTGAKSQLCSDCIQEVVSGGLLQTFALNVVHNLLRLSTSYTITRPFQICLVVCWKQVNL